MALPISYDPARTRDVIATLRNLQNNPNVKQKFGSLGAVNEKRIGAVCALGGIRNFCDSYRNKKTSDSEISADLPLSTFDIIRLNDRSFLSFGKIADRIEEAALANGGEEKLYSFLDG